MTMRTAAVFSFLWAARMFAGDGVAPRARVSDYPARQDVKAGGVKTAALAAAVVPAEQVRKLFSSDIARDWIVVEVAVYPEDGKSFDADGYDFSLKIGDRIARSENGVDVAGLGEPKLDNRAPDPRVQVTQEAGVAIGHTSYPQGTTPQGAPGPRTTVGTWESTTVSNRPSAPPPPPSNGVDPRELASKLRDKELPEGITQKAVAGYLYFRAGKRRKNDALTLEYTKGEIEADLKLPAK